MLSQHDQAQATVIESNRIEWTGRILINTITNRRRLVTAYTHEKDSTPPSIRKMLTLQPQSS